MGGFNPLNNMKVSWDFDIPNWMENIYTVPNHQPGYTYRRKFRSQTSENMDRWKAEQGRGREKRKISRRKFRSQTSDNMDRWKAEQGRGREKRKIRRKKSRRERVRRKKMQMREKVGKSRNTVFFQWFGAPEGRKVGSLAGAEPAGQMRNEKLHAVVARSTFRSQNVQNTPFSDHFWKLRCRKSARRCGAKHISKSKCTKHLSVGALLEVAMSKKCTPLWREAHFQVKMYKTPQRQTAFGSCDVEKVHAVVARSTFRSQHVQNTPCTDHFWRVEMSKKCTPLWREAHFEVEMLKKH